MYAYLHFQQPTLILFLFLLPAVSKARPCSDGFVREAHVRNVTGNCRRLTLGAEFGWNYNNNTRKLEILFGAKLNGEMGWLAWGLNPGEQPKMVGTRALIGIKEKKMLYNGTYNITSSTLFGCGLHPSKIELQVLNLSFFYLKHPMDIYIIQATIVLPKEYIDSRANLVWQVGNAAIGEQPLMHPVRLEHCDSKEKIDLVSGNLLSFEHRKLHKLRTVHGILNILGWGTLLPVGVMIPRYFRRFPIECPLWFTLHISCQILGYTLGTIAFVIGLLLQSASGYYSQLRIHRILGITVFAFATLQMMALRLKPDRQDGYRVFWNMYHHFLGYSLLAMISVNIFQGISIISTDHAWIWAYVGILVLLGTIAFGLELFSWIKFCWNRNRKSASTTPIPAAGRHPSGSVSGTDSQRRSSQ